MTHVDEVLAQPTGLSGRHHHRHTTSVPGPYKTRAWKERGFTYLHAPVFMGPQNALDSHWLYAGIRQPGRHRKLEPNYPK